MTYATQEFGKTKQKACKIQGIKLEYLSKKK